MAASPLDAVLRAGLRLQAEAPERFEAEATGACKLFGFKKQLRADSFKISKMNGQVVDVKGTTQKDGTVYSNKEDANKSLVTFRTSYGGMHNREYLAMVVNEVKVVYFAPPKQGQEGKFRYIANVQIVRTPFGQHDIIDGRVPMEQLQFGSGTGPTWEVGSKVCLDTVAAFELKLGNPTNEQWAKYLNYRASFNRTAADPEFTKLASAAKRGWAELKTQLENFIWNLARMNQHRAK